MDLLLVLWAWNTFVPALKRLYKAQSLTFTLSLAYLHTEFGQDNRQPKLAVVHLQLANKIIKSSRVEVHSQISGISILGNQGEEFFKPFHVGCYSGGNEVLRVWIGPELCKPDPSRVNTIFSSSRMKHDSRGTYASAASCGERWLATASLSRSLFC